MEASDLSTPGEGPAEREGKKGGGRSEGGGGWRFRPGESVPGQKPEGRGRARSHVEPRLLHVGRKGHVCPECGEDKTERNQRNEEPTASSSSSLRSGDIPVGTPKEQHRMETRNGPTDTSTSIDGEGSGASTQARSPEEKHVQQPRPRGGENGKLATKREGQC